MKYSACALLLFLTASHLATAADATAGREVPADVSTAPAAVAPAAVPPLELKHNSSFELEENGRNPFWPIGWKPALRKSTATETAGPEVGASAFTVSSITVDVGGRFAIINGKVMSEGEVFGLQLGSQTYQITVKAIGDGRVVLLRRDEEIEVPLRRR